MTVAAIQEDLNETSDRISTTVRSVSLGVLALVWLFLAGGKDAPALISLIAYRWHLVVIAALCILALLFDLSQYICGYKCSLNALLEMEDSEEEGQPKGGRKKAYAKSYDFSETYHFARRGFFWMKLLAVLAASFWMLGLLGAALLGDNLPPPSVEAAASDDREVRQKDAAAVGRYEFFQGWYRSVNLKGEESRTETLFEIDTATGELLECSSVQFLQGLKGMQKSACLPFENEVPLAPQAVQ